MNTVEYYLIKNKLSAPNDLTSQSVLRKFSGGGGYHGISRYKGSAIWIYWDWEPSESDWFISKPMSILEIFEALHDNLAWAELDNLCEIL
jgi:hypothetical protein